MKKSIIIENQKVDYDDKEFNVLRDQKNERDLSLEYIGNDINIRNPKGNTTCCFMFNFNTNEKLDLRKFNTENVKDMSGMFFHSIVQELNLSNFNTKNVKDMSSMFDGCKKLKELDLTSFSFRQKPEVGYMFENCNCVVYVKNERDLNYLIENTKYTNIKIKNSTMIYKVYKIGVNGCKIVNSQSPKEAIYKAFGLNKNQIEVLKVEYPISNVYVKGDKSNDNFYLVKTK